MIVIIAPYTGTDITDIDINLGASKKIRFFITALAKLSSNIILVNSAHNNCSNTSFIIRKINISNVIITEIVLPTKRNRLVGKLFNLLDAEKAISIVSSYGQPQLIWCYNAYAFEMIFARKAYSKFKSKMILEFEDWHFSRSRGYSLKPYIDMLFWRIAARYFQRIYVINSYVKNKNVPFCKDIQLLPGVVSNEIIEIDKLSQPFSCTNGYINIGYFGGLNRDKGANIVLELRDHLPSNYIIHSTGSGTLKNDFLEKSKLHKDTFIYHGMVKDYDLINIIGKCDIILNPHVPVAKFQNGIFPFKVIEAIASGRLLISTELPTDELDDLLDNVIFVDYSSESFANAIIEGRSYYEKNYKLIKLSAKKANNLFSENALVNSLSNFLAL
ncbi:glycosyltransferase [Spirosoma sp. KUDC1026]|uniref:glycosyltransferase n=1 Tax=Spirosoma sp. KUDC1026 TaxID=2745947 RepID=UPI00159BD138|nr:glycosyltransferase [Spirosoma sp. KUDC1026]QKZ15432.1 glycosyltransferase [Spirosoma sp. KUDC1026]